jgi:hypothetical protein
MLRFDQLYHLLAFLFELLLLELIHLIQADFDLLVWKACVCLACQYLFKSVLVIGYQILKAIAHQHSLFMPVFQRLLPLLLLLDVDELADNFKHLLEVFSLLTHTCLKKFHLYLQGGLPHLGTSCYGHSLIYYKYYYYQ